MSPSQPLPTALDIEAAYVRLRSVVRETPLIRSDRLSTRTGANIWVKREDLQPVRSYKIRGAYNLIAQLDANDRQRGVVCASAGNHAQGVAYACARLDLHARIYLPRTTPRQKRDRIAVLGQGHVELVVGGDTYDDAAAACHEDAGRTGAVIVPAFDHAATIAGQGTLAVEVVHQLGHHPDQIVLPVGGGGMIAGCVTWLAARHPATAVMGAEPAGAASMRAAMTATAPVTLPTLDTFVDGAAVRRVGDLTHRICQHHQVPLVAVDEGRICTEMLELYQTDGIIAEPAGALASAALLDQLDPAPGSDVVVVLSGGNNDISRYAEVLERSLVAEGRKHYFLVNFPQEPGALRRFVEDVLGPDDDIALFEYVKRSNRETGPALVGIELGDPHDLDGLLARMATSRMVVEQIPADSPFYRFLV
ncbi:L-threonine dehydratase biosynthetic IlvA [Austwickia sp. TVS 96-490-7B]|uniref:threonine ammonia-lyase IlvA n=1 Tax=Austwickia sp. TVS 96-490-7B TaxID=2830843 RepID=UPI001C595413|nr:threonine ammonia-lyase IlvA [Austwickia sp. TVS 96-490-7B]MBW3083881.1 L-threonine dehydratase biosynthetic IlvA [Austwickia sp. TVS 96-490-7B]